MASAFFRKDREQWMADIHGFAQPSGKRHVIRVPLSRLRNPATAADDAKAYADECERYARIVEGTHEPADVAHALRLGVITQAQADALHGGGYVPPRSEPPARLTLRAAALSHPSSARDSLTDQVRYLGYLDQFTAVTHVAHVSEVRVEAVTAWLASLTAKGWAWDTKRHALLYLRRACKMGAASGFPDVLAGMQLNRRVVRRERIVVWSLPDLLAAIRATEDHRIRAVLSLGGLLGLRPSEIIRANSTDLQGDVLHVGSVEAKNDASVRSLVVPPFVLPHLAAAIGKRTPGPIVSSLGPRSKGKPLTLYGLHQVLADHFAAQKSPGLAPKLLRKTFATWASRAVAAADLERYLGHQTALHAGVTARHYLASYEVEALRPAAAAMQTTITNALNHRP